MKCLVTGGAGFIGSHLCDWLIAEGSEVICVDNLITGNKRNLSGLFNHPRFHFIQADCSKPLTQFDDIDVIYHLASPASPPKYQKYFLETMLVNTYSTYLLLEQARKWKAKFLFASTSEVYGDPLIHPQPETYWGNVNPNGVRSCYDESKRMGEAFVMSYVRNFNIDARIVRLFNTYGPRMDIDDGRVVTNFIKQILHGKPLIVHGNGTQTRSFCYISDMVEGIVKVAQTEVARGEIINLGNTEEKTVSELADLIKLLMKSHAAIVYKDLPEDDPQRRQPDINKAKLLLGWEPKIPLIQGLKLTIEYFQKNK